jgi:hypothetical protein
MLTRLLFKLPTAPVLPDDPKQALPALFRAYFELVHAIDDWFRVLNKKGALYGLGDAGVATGTPTAGSGSFTTASYTINWTALGDRLLYNGSVVITTNGAAATSVVVPLPTGYAPKESSAGSGVDDTTRVQLSVRVDASLKSVAVRNYDGTYPGANGKTLLFSGQFRF